MQGPDLWDLPEHVLQNVGLWGTLGLRVCRDLRHRIMEGSTSIACEPEASAVQVLHRHLRTRSAQQPVQIVAKGGTVEELHGLVQAAADAAAQGTPWASVSGLKITEVSGQRVSP